MVYLASGEHPVPPLAPTGTGRKERQIRLNVILHLGKIKAVFKAAADSVLAIGERLTPTNLRPMRDRVFSRGRSKFDFNFVTRLERITNPLRLDTRPLSLRASMV